MSNQVVGERTIQAEKGRRAVVSVHPESLADIFQLRRGPMEGDGESRLDLLGQVLDAAGREFPLGWRWFHVVVFLRQLAGLWLGLRAYSAKGGGVAPCLGFYECHCLYP